MSKAYTKCLLLFELNKHGFNNVEGQCDNSHQIPLNRHIGDLPLLPKGHEGIGHFLW